MRLKQSDTASRALVARVVGTDGEHGLDGASGNEMGKRGARDAGAGLGDDALLERGRGIGGLAGGGGRRRGALGGRAGTLVAAAAILSRCRQLKRRQARRKSAGEGEDEREDAAEHDDADVVQKRPKSKSFLVGLSCRLPL